MDQSTKRRQFFKSLAIPVHESVKSEILAITNAIIQHFSILFLREVQYRLFQEIVFHHPPSYSSRSLFYSPLSDPFPFGTFAKLGSKQNLRTKQDRYFLLDQNLDLVYYSPNDTHFKSPKGKIFLGNCYIVDESFCASIWDKMFGTPMPPDPLIGHAASLQVRSRAPHERIWTLLFDGDDAQRERVRDFLIQACYLKTAACEECSAVEAALGRALHYTRVRLGQCEMHNSHLCRAIGLPVDVLVNALFDHIQPRFLLRLYRARGGSRPSDFFSYVRRIQGQTLVALRALVLEEWQGICAAMDDARNRYAVLAADPAQRTELSALDEHLRLAVREALDRALPPLLADVAARTESLTTALAPLLRRMSDALADNLCEAIFSCAWQNLQLEIPALRELIRDRMYYRSGTRPAATQAPRTPFNATALPLSRFGGFDFPFAAPRAPSPTAAEAATTESHQEASFVLHCHAYFPISPVALEAVRQSAPFASQSEGSSPVPLTAHALRVCLTRPLFRAAQFGSRLPADVSQELIERIRGALGSGAPRDGESVGTHASLLLAPALAEAWGAPGIVTDVGFLLHNLQRDLFLEAISIFENRLTELVATHLAHAEPPPEETEAGWRERLATAAPPSPAELEDSRHIPLPADITARLIGMAATSTYEVVQRAGRWVLGMHLYTVLRHCFLEPALQAALPGLAATLRPLGQLLPSQHKALQPFHLDFLLEEMAADEILRTIAQAAARNCRIDRSTPCPFTHTPASELAHYARIAQETPHAPKPRFNFQCRADGSRDCSATLQ